MSYKNKTAEELQKAKVRLKTSRTIALCIAVGSIIAGPIVANTSTSGTSISMVSFIIPPIIITIVASCVLWAFPLYKSRRQVLDYYLAEALKAEKIAAQEAEKTKKRQQFIQTVSEGKYVFPYKEFYSKCKKEECTDIRSSEYNQKKAKLLADQILKTAGIPSEYYHLYDSEPLLLKYLKQAEDAENKEEKALEKKRAEEAKKTAQGGSVKKRTGNNRIAGSSRGIIRPGKKTIYSGKNA